MAIACFGLVTFLPPRPDFSLPFFISRISISTFFPADGEYLRFDVFFELDFFADELRVLFFVLLLDSLWLPSWLPQLSSSEVRWHLSRGKLYGRRGRESVCV